MKQTCVAILCPGCGGGGSVAQVALNHIRVLSASFKVVLLSDSLPGWRISGVEYVKISSRRFNSLRRFCHVPNELAFLHAMKKALVALSQRCHVDVVMCHSHSLAEMACRLKKALGYKVIMTTHGDIFDRPPGTYTRELTWFYRWVTPKAYVSSDRVQALSIYMAERAVQGGAPAATVRVIPNGVDVDEIGAGELVVRDSESFIRGGVLCLLYVGNLWSLKGLDVLVRAIHALANARKKKRELDARIYGQIELRLVGDGPEYGRLKILVDELGMQTQVHFCGRKPRKELASYYRQADILCLPSFSEALPTVVIEAMCCGLPVVGSNIGGIAQLVSQDENGCLAAPGDIAQLATAISKAAASRGNLARLGANAYARARKHYTWEQVGRQLENLVLETLKER